MSPTAKVFRAGGGLNPHGGEREAKREDELQMLEGDFFYIKLDCLQEQS